MNALSQPSKKFIDEIRVDFLVITALPEERDAVLQYFKLEDSITIDESFVGFLCYVETQLGSINVVVTTLSSMGNVEAGIHASRVIEILKPSFVVMVGIVGGIKDRVRKGGVLVAHSLSTIQRANNHQWECRYDPMLYRLIHSCCRLLKA